LALLTLDDAGDGVNVSDMSCRRMIVLVVVLVALVGVIAVLSHNPYAPRFRKTKSFTAPPYKTLHYDFLAERPFEGGQTWLTLIDGTNGSASFLFDLENRKVVGQLLNASPAYSSADKSKLLCITRGPTFAPWVERCKATAASALGRFKVSIPKFLRPTQTQTRSENYWTLDLKTGRATLLGQVSQFEGTGSSFHPSPDFRFGFNKPTTANFTNLIWICDLKENRIRDAHAEGWPSGWWDNQRIVMRAKNNDFVLFDVLSGTSSPLLTASNIVTFLDEHNVEHQNQRPAPLLTWNGRDFEFYVTDRHRKWSAEESFLLKVVRPDARLSIVTPNFKFEWSDHFDPSQRFYVYSGREAGQRSDGVFLRDLETGKERTLIEPQGERRFSIPHFYKDSVLYLRSNAVWRVGLNGSNNVRLFP
jgi:hypothetical protein